MPDSLEALVNCDEEFKIYTMAPNADLKHRPGKRASAEPLQNPACGPILRIPAILCFPAHDACERCCNDTDGRKLLPLEPAKPLLQTPVAESQEPRSHLGTHSILPLFMYSVKQGGHVHVCSGMSSSGLPRAAASCI